MFINEVSKCKSLFFQSVWSPFKLLCWIVMPWSFQVGFVNSLQFSPEGDFLLVSVGQEHRLGRWWRIKQAKNALYIIPLPRKDKDSWLKDVVLDCMSSCDCAQENITSWEMNVVFEVQNKWTAYIWTIRF